MGNLTEHVMINKWDDDINSAITFVGGNTYGSEGLPDYADIIRTQLIANSAIGEGIYQDFLYVNDQNQTFIYPWEGEATKSSNAIQSKVVAETIKVLYDTMALTERFTVLLVDDFPKGEIDLSAVYLVKSKCECEECPEDCNCKENTYVGCYYVKQGKSIRRVDIPEFKFNLNELFYLTRAEYDAGLSDYVKEIEDLLRKKFGKYWDDDGFTLDKAVEEIQQELKDKTEQLIEETNKKLEEALNTVEETITNAETRLNEKFDTLESEVNEKVEDIQAQVTGLDAKVTEIDTKVDEKFVELDTQFNELQTSLETNVNEKFNTLKSEVDEKVEGIQEQVDTIEQDVVVLESTMKTEYVRYENLEAINTELEELK